MDKRDLTTISDLNLTDIWKIFQLTEGIKQRNLSEGNTGEYKPLDGKSIALLFLKPSTRTRVSFEVGILQLGGHSIYLGPDEAQPGKRESFPDISRTLSCYVDAIVARTYSHHQIELLAQYSSVPIINGLSDLFHPCQILADIYTIWKKKGKVVGINLTYIGDGSNNIAHSLLLGGAIVGMNITIATPKEFLPDSEVILEAQNLSSLSGSQIRIINDPLDAVFDADVLYTDVWTSMGQEEESENREKIFQPYQINQALLNRANNDCVIMHCLPAYRGKEITDEVIDGPQSIIFEQAENRLHVQKGVLVFLLR